MYTKDKDGIHKHTSGWKRKGGHVWGRCGSENLAAVVYDCCSVLKRVCLSLSHGLDTQTHAYERVQLQYFKAEISNKHTVASLGHLTTGGVTSITLTTISHSATFSYASVMTT